MKMILTTTLNKLTGAIPTRFNIAVMIFTACWVTYMLRVNMSLNILEMVEVTDSSAGNSTSTECLSTIPEIKINTTLDDFHVDVDAKILHNEEKFNWTVKQQGLLLGAYFWGNVVTSLFAGTIAEAVGPKITVGLSIFLSGIITLLSPPAAFLGFEALLISRVLIGGLGGFLYPSLHCIVASWAPPEEKGKFIGALLGGTFGTVITWSLCGLIIDTLGWKMAFYIPGIITVLWSILWQLIVSDSPLDHPRIDPAERSHIMERIGDRNTKKKPFPPLKSILLSIPFWAFTILHFGNVWGLFFQLTSGPKYITQVLGFKIVKGGFIASLPYLARVLMGFIFGSIGDALRKKEKITVTCIRKTFVLFSHIIPGLLLIALGYTGCDAMLSVIILTASLGMNGAATLTNLQNHQDLSPNFVGTLYSIANSIGGTTGFITPMITAHYTKEKNGIEEWRSIFIIGATVYILTGVIFMIFGSGNTQKWNEIKENEDNCEKPKTETPSKNADVIRS